MSLVDHFIDRLNHWRCQRRKLTFKQVEALDALEMRPDHLETVDKAIVVNGHLLSLVFFGAGATKRSEADACAVVLPTGEIRWMDETGTQEMAS
jgi:hypothetical protein